MKKLYALCLLTLVAVVLDIVVFHPRSVTAQSNPRVHVERVQFGLNATSGDASIEGGVVGFHCIDTASGPQCFVASIGSYR
jgi:hypothetical protein